MMRHAVTRARGFVAAGLSCGIKRSRKRDIALIMSECPAVSAAAFTTNRVQAWPVQYSARAIKRPVHSAILATSGNANCFNGPQGREAVEESVQALAHELQVPPSHVLIASTGLIGARYPTNRVLKALPHLVRSLSRDGGHHAAQGILTTDTKTKEVVEQCHIGRARVTIGGIAKGAGMVNPCMATMLCFLTTDVAITKPALNSALKAIVKDTFNTIGIDNDMSTNDTVFILANGTQRNATITSIASRAGQTFYRALHHVCAAIAYQLVEDGEGVTKVCQVHVKGAPHTREAARVARQVGQSMLVKTMLAGGDPNWGRIVGAVGAAANHGCAERIDITFGPHTVVKNGRVQARQLVHAHQFLRGKHIPLVIDLKRGRQAARFLTCDLTKSYVHINSAYTS